MLVALRGFSLAAIADLFILVGALSKLASAPDSFWLLAMVGERTDKEGDVKSSFKAIESMDLAIVFLKN